MPMTEYFDVTVSRDREAPDAVTVQEETLFITRNLVKFVFEFSKDSYVPYESIKVKGITFSKLMQKEFLMPNNLFYKPAKYRDDGSVDSSNERVVTSFVTPGMAGNQLRPFRFSPDNFGISGSGKMNLSIKPPICLRYISVRPTSQTTATTTHMPSTLSWNATTKTTQS